MPILFSIIIGSKSLKLKKNKLGNVIQQPKYFNWKGCRAAEFSKNCKPKLKRKAGIGSITMVHLVLRSLESLAQRTLVLFYCNWVLNWSFFFTGKQEKTLRLNQKSVVWKLGIVYLIVVYNLQHHFHTFQVIFLWLELAFGDFQWNLSAFLQPCASLKIKFGLELEVNNLFKASFLKPFF